MPRLSTLRVTALAWMFVAIAIGTMSRPAGGQDTDRSGREVVDAVCAECHTTGANDAPRIGDEDAWRARASQGLTVLTRHALDGIRQMPAHGGQPQLSDLEIARAVTYMVNQSGGDWVAPASTDALATDKPGREIVEAYCGECHGSGEGGAPRIGDKEAWIPRLRHGIPYAVQSAVTGHGGMPPRGGAADLTDREIRNAIIYMFNPGSAAGQETARGSGGTAKVSADGSHANVQGIDIYLGLMPADRIRRFPQGSVERSMHGGLPAGDGWQHLNVSLLDAETHAPITDARVEVRFIGNGQTWNTKRLEAMAIGQGSYGGYLRMQPGTQYRIIVLAQSPDLAKSIEVEFVQQTAMRQ